MTTTYNQVKMIVTLQKIQGALERRPWTRSQFIRSIAQRGLTKPSVIDQALGIVKRQLQLAVLGYPWALVIGTYFDGDSPAEIDPEWPVVREQQTLDRLLITANRIRRWGVYCPEPSRDYRFWFEGAAQIMMGLQALRYPVYHADIKLLCEVQRRTFLGPRGCLLSELGRALYSDPDVRSGKPPTRDKVDTLLQKILNE